MKKICALFLALLLCVGMASAAEWKDGLSPAQPYPGVGAVDLTQKLGYMMFYPNKTTSAEHCCRSLCIYLPREDVKAGTGKLYVCSLERGEELRLSFDDAETVVQRPMTETELIGMMWGGGTCFEVRLPWSLNLNEGYFVNLDAGCIVSADDKVTNAVIGGTDSWAFTTECEYGIGAMEYTRPIPGDPEAEPERFITNPAAGDELEFDLLLGGEAVQVILYAHNASVEFDAVQIAESGHIAGRVLTGNPAWSAIFLDAQGNELSVLNF